MPRPTKAEVMGGGVVVTRTTTQKTLVPTQSPVMAALDKARCYGIEAKEIGLGMWFDRVFSVPDIEMVCVFRVLPDGRYPKIGNILRAQWETRSPDEDVEGGFLARFGGPGKFNLRPMSKGMMYGNRYVEFGLTNEPDAGTQSITNIDVDRELALAAKRITTTETLRSLRSLGKGDDEPMKTEELIQVMTLLRAQEPARNGTDPLMTIMLEELRANRQMMMQMMATPKTTETTQLLTPFIDLIKEKATPTMLRGLLQGFQPKTATVAAAEPNMWADLFDAVKPLLAGLAPAFGQILASKVTGAPVVPPPVVQDVAALPEHTTTQGGVGTMKYEYDADEKEVIDQVVQWIRTGRFNEARAALMLLPHPEVRLFMQALDPAVNPEAYVFSLRRIDPRLTATEEAKAGALDFIRSIQAAIMRDMEPEPEPGPAS